MLYRTLGQTGLEVSCIGFGASPFGDVFGAVSLDDCQRAVDAAIAGGINLFDVSPYYGHTLAETRLGETLKSKRPSILLATKCGRYGAADFDFSKDRILHSVDESLSRLQTDYIDILQAHDIEFGHCQQILEETIPALLQIKAEGKARFIGVTGYQLRMLAAVAAAAPVDTLLSYCRSNLLVDDLDSLLLPTVKAKGIALINASPLHMGLLAPGEPPPWHPAPEAVKTVARKVVDLCRDRGVSASQLAIQHCLRHESTTTTLLGLGSVSQVESCLEVFNQQFDPSLLSAAEDLIRPIRNRVWPSGLPENQDYPQQQVNSPS